jgi:hypothetical protein
MTSYTQLEEYNDAILHDKIIGRMTGCFCPPHKGHFLTWERACKDLNLDILFISSSNDINPYKSRHGIPIAFTEWVVSKWAAHLKNQRGTPVQVIFRSDTPLPKIASNKFKQLYLIHIGEGDGKTKEENEKEKEIWLTTMHEKKNSDLDEPDISWGKRKGITQERLNKTDTYPMYKISNKTYWRDTTNPDAQSPSATKFTACLKEYKIDSSHEHLTACYAYLPDFMRDGEKKEYIDKIMTEYYTDDSYDKCFALLKLVERCNKFDFSGQTSTKRRKLNEGGKKRTHRKKRKVRHRRRTKKMMRRK